MDSKIVHLLFASDADGVEGLAVAAFSTLELCSRPVHVWVIEDRISRQAQDRLETTWRRCSTYSGSTFIPMSSLPIRMPSQWARRDWPLTAAARFQVADVLPKDINRCLYLDIDVLAGVDVAELFDLDLRGNPVGMAVATRMPETDKEYLRTLNLDPDVYCNSGVALIDLDAWRREEAGKGLIRVGRAMPPNIWFYDQDILNTYFKGRCLLLEERWNYRDAAILPEGKIQHFAGSTKPWKVTAATAPGAGHAAWHRAKQRSGFEALPIPAYVKWRKTFTAVTAKVQRRISELARKWTPTQTNGPL